LSFEKTAVKLYIRDKRYSGFNFYRYNRVMEELHTDSIDGGHEGQLWARSRARERAYSNIGAVRNCLNIVFNTLFCSFSKPLIRA
jgi:hypothetical protein